MGTEKFSQIVVFGANGWMGRSAISVSAKLKPRSQILLLGSKKSTLRVDGKDFEILTAEEGLSKIEDNSLFLNYAFLRREKLMTLSSSEFVEKNKALTNFAAKVLKIGKIGTFINASSGVTKNLQINGAGNQDLYAKMKFEAENELHQTATECNSAYINVRIFSLSGRFLNEFQNLALSNFIAQGKQRANIVVRQPYTIRSYVDAEELNDLLFRLSIDGFEGNLESGGEPVTMKMLAEKVANRFGVQTEVIESRDAPSTYIGDNARYQKLASELKSPMSSIEDQIEKTLLAF